MNHSNTRGRTGTDEKGVLERCGFSHEEQNGASFFWQLVLFGYALLTCRPCAFRGLHFAGNMTMHLAWMVPRVFALARERRARV